MHKLILKEKNNVMQKKQSQSHNYLAELDVASSNIRSIKYKNKLLRKNILNEISDIQKRWNEGDEPTINLYSI